MPRKARPEGARHTRHNFVQPGVVTRDLMADKMRAAAAKAEIEALPAARPLANPVPGDDGEALDRIAASFRQRFPDEWAAMAKCPLESCLPEMARVLKGKG